MTHSKFRDKTVGPKKPKDPNLIMYKQQKHEQLGGRYYPIKRIDKNNIQLDEWGAVVNHLSDFHEEQQMRQQKQDKINKKQYGQFLNKQKMQFEQTDDQIQKEI